MIFTRNKQDFSSGTARVVVVTDKNNVVRYIRVVPEVTELPDMAAAMEVAKSLL